MKTYYYVDIESLKLVKTTTDKPDTCMRNLGWSRTRSDAIKVAIRSLKCGINFDKDNIASKQKDIEFCLNMIARKNDRIEKLKNTKPSQLVPYEAGVQVNEAGVQV